VTQRRPSPLAVVFAVLSALAGCELIADFDQSKLDENRTVGPTPLPTTDGAVAVVPDGSTQFDGALLRDDASTTPVSDASASDGGAPLQPVDGLDASVADAAPEAAVQDAGSDDAALDAAPDAAPVDAGTDAGREPEDAGLELFADV